MKNVIIVKPIKYKGMVWAWYCPPNNVPVFENKFFKRNFVHNNVVDIEEAECARQQLIAIREGLTK